MRLQAPESLRRIYFRVIEEGKEYTPSRTTYRGYVALRDNVPAFSHVATSAHPTAFTLGHGSNAQSAQVQPVSGNKMNLVGMFGVAAGLLFAYWSIELMDAFLLGLEPFDPAVFGVAAVLVLGMVLLAALPSALRSGSVNPQEALRNT